MCFQSVTYVQKMIVINSQTESETQFVYVHRRNVARLVFKPVSLRHYVETLSSTDLYLGKAARFSSPNEQHHSRCKTRF